MHRDAIYCSPEPSSETYSRPVMKQANTSPSSKSNLYAEHTRVPYYLQSVLPLRSNQQLRNRCCDIFPGLNQAGQRGALLSCPWKFILFRLTPTRARRRVFAETYLSFVRLIHLFGCGTSGKVVAKKFSENLRHCS